jgi:aspartyl protease family protein
VAAISIYWEDFKNSKFYAGMVAGEGAKSSDGSVAYMRADDGHFHINAEVEGVRVKFMVDTGASSIVLNQADARRIGVDVENLSYDRVYRTANGTTRGASVMLKNMIIGGQVLNNIPASVNKGELDSSLLGMTFLDRLRSYKIEGDSLILDFTK